MPCSVARVRVRLERGGLERKRERTGHGVPRPLPILSFLDITTQGPCQNPTR